MHPKTLTYAFLAVILLGLADSLYLSLTTFLQVSPVCGPAHGCDIVQTSAYSRFLGIPWAYLAVVYYTVGAFIGPALAHSMRARALAVVFGALGVLVALWSAYLQLVVLQAFCIYCTALDIFQVILLVFALLLVRSTRNSEPSPQ